MKKSKNKNVMSEKTMQYKMAVVIFVSSFRSCVNFMIVFFQITV